MVNRKVFMKDYFDELVYKLNRNKHIKITQIRILQKEMHHTFEIFEMGISDEIKYIYNNYKEFLINWEENNQEFHGFVNFIPYENILLEHNEICEIAECMEDNLIENQESVIDDLKNWYPIFKFPNGDAFCYDKRNGKIVFFEHEVFDIGVNLNGLIIAESIVDLLNIWSRVLFMDIYDWYEGVNEHGIDLSKSIYSKVLELS